MGIGAFLVGWAAEAIIDAQNTGSTGTGFGNLGVTLLVIGLGATVGTIGLALVLFRPTRPVGSLVAAGAWGLACGVVFGFVMLM